MSELSPNKKHGVLKKDYVVKKSKTGLGLFANRDYKKGEFVVEYIGERIDEPESNRRGGQYLFELSKKWFLDGKFRENTARYVNHSCRPNCEADVKKEHVLISAIKNIKKGDEFVYDYGKEFFDEYIKPKGCKCEKCTKTKAKI